MYNSVSVIWNSNPVATAITGGSLLFPAALTVISAKTQFFDHLKTNSISQLIDGLFKILQKLLKSFSGITTSISSLPTFFASEPASPLPTLLVFHVVLVLYLKDSELEERGVLGSSL